MTFTQAIQSGFRNYARFSSRATRSEFWFWVLFTVIGGVVGEVLARDVWQETQRYTPLDNVIDVHIAHLRKKLDEPFKKKLLHTVRGVGFVLREEAP